MEALTGRQSYAEWRLTHPPVMGGAPTIEELEDRNKEIHLRLQTMDVEAQGRSMSDDEKSEWNRISQEFKTNEETTAEMRRRKEWLTTLDRQRMEPGAQFNTPTPRGQSRRDDIWDVSTIRSHFNDPESMAFEAKERAKQAISEFVFPHPDIAQGRVSDARVRDHLTRLLETAERSDGALSMHILRAGSPLYRQAFGKVLLGGEHALTRDEERALAVATGSAGGYAVPITLDPTLIPTSNGVVNPMRAVARVETIVGLEYRGLTAGAVTASYAPEGTEASDNSPLLAQPDVFVERAQAFVPYSIEIGMDWTGLQAGMAKLIQDAKDVLEGTKFTLGSGHNSNEPQGLLTGATTTVSASGSASFAVADLYNLETNLPPRFRPLGQFFANRYIYNQVRQFGASANQNLWMPLANPNLGPLGHGLDNRPFQQGGNIGERLLGYPANEVSDMANQLSTTSKILAIGDPNYYLIVDRIGMTVELIPHLFGSNRRPTGQRGLYAYWRNTGVVVDPNAWRVLVTS